MKKNIRHGDMRLRMEGSEDDKPMALGEVRVYWKFLERRDDIEEYGVLRITYAGKYEEPDLWDGRTTGTTWSKTCLPTCSATIPAICKRSWPHWPD